MATGFPPFFFFSTNTFCAHNCKLLLLVQNLLRQKLHAMKCPEMKQVLWCFANPRNQPSWSIFSSLEKLLPSSFQDWRCHSFLVLLAVGPHTILNSAYTYALICIWFLSVNLMSVRAIHIIHSSASDYSSFFFFQWVISHGNLQTQCPSEFHSVIFSAAVFCTCSADYTVAHLYACNRITETITNWFSHVKPTSRFWTEGHCIFFL